MATPQALVDHALDVSAADHCSVLLRQTSTANLRWANNTLTTNGVMSACHVTVVSQISAAGGTAAGVVTEPASSPSEVADLVARADAAARDASAAEDANSVVSGSEAADWDEPPGSTSIDVFDTFASDLGEALSRARLEGRLLYGYVDHAVETTYLATSAGLRLRHEQPSGHVGITGKPSDLSTSAWVGQATDDFSDVDVAALDDALVKRIGWATRSVDLPAGRYETLLPPTAVADLLTYAYFVSSGRDAHEGRTVFSAPGGGTRLGQRIARPGVRVFSDPRHPGLHAIPFVAARSSSSSTSVFDNGLPVGPADWILDGTLTALPTSRYTASLTGLDVHPLVDNLVLEVTGGAGSVDDLVAGSERALLLTCLWYIRKVDSQELLLTGLTRDGSYLVEHGEVVGAVNNFRFNESPISLLGRFTEAGSTERSFSREWGDVFKRTATPALRIPDFNMSSVSQAS
ncbi:MAG: metallopeptidase TldD-related protein [Nocardioidaceae bacterium]